MQLLSHEFEIENLINWTPTFVGMARRMFFVTWVAFTMCGKINQHVFHEESIFPVGAIFKTLIILSLLMLLSTFSFAAEPDIANGVSLSHDADDQEQAESQFPFSGILLPTYRSRYTPRIGYNSFVDNVPEATALNETASIYVITGLILILTGIIKRYRLRKIKTLETIYSKSIRWASLLIFAGVLLTIPSLWLYAKASQAVAASKLFDQGADYVRPDQYQNYAAAVKYWQKAADLGNDFAQYNLGVLSASDIFTPGEGWAQVGYGKYRHTEVYIAKLPKDDREAFKWFSKAADRNEEAQFNLAGLYILGHGVARDDVMAIKLLRDLAEKHSDKAQLYLGLCYAQGKGVPQSYEEAYYWLSLPGPSHYIPQIDDEWTKKLSDARDDAEKHLTAEQMASVKTRIKAYMDSRPHGLGITF